MVWVFQWYFIANDFSSNTTEGTNKVSEDESRTKSKTVKETKTKTSALKDETKRGTLDPRIKVGLESGKSNESENKSLEQHLVVAKMNWANAELKVDLLKEEVKQLRKTIKILELDLVKTKQNLGEAMNAVYEYERKNTILIEKLQEHGIPLEGLNAKGSISSTDKAPWADETSEFTKKYMKK